MVHYVEDTQAVALEVLDFIEKIYYNRLNIKVEDDVLDKIIDVLDAIPEVWNADYRHHH